MIRIKVKKKEPARWNPEAGEWQGELLEGLVWYSKGDPAGTVEIEFWDGRWHKAEVIYEEVRQQG